jgi:hypothetical protein
MVLGLIQGQGLAYGTGPDRSFGSSLGKYVTAFQTEIYTILQCAYENIRRAYRHKQILIFSDSQAACKALSSLKVTSRLVAEYLDALPVLANCNVVTLIQVLGYFGIAGNEKLTKLLVKVQQCHYLVHSRLLEYLGVQQEKQLRTGLSFDNVLPGKIYKVTEKS